MRRHAPALRRPRASKTARADETDLDARREINAIVRQPAYRRRLDYIFTGSWHAHPHAR
jgi:hypothetical protein